MLLFIPVKPPVPCPYSDILSHLLCRFRRYRRIFTDTISAKLKAYRGPYRERKSVADIVSAPIFAIPISAISANRRNREQPYFPKRSLGPSSFRFGEFM